MKCSRRKCLTLLALSTSAFGFSSLLRADEPQVREFLSFVASRPEAAFIGRVAAARLGFSASQLETELARSLSRFNSHGSPNNLAGLLSAAIEADFKAGDIVSVHGWPAGRTEAMAYAWAYVHAGDLRR